MIRNSEDLPGKCETVGVNYSVEEMFKQLNLPGYWRGISIVGDLTCQTPNYQILLIYDIYDLNISRFQPLDI
jgi:hypothetical protein